MRKLNLIIGLTSAILFVLTMTPILAEAGPANSPLCEGLSGKAMGICTAMIVQDCDKEENKSQEACQKLEDIYRDETGENPPWTLMLLRTYKQDFNADGIIDTAYYYTFDANGNQTKNEYDYDGDGIIDTAYYFAYDANGNQTIKKCDSDGDGTIDRAYYNTYDANGNLVKYEYDSDGDGNIDRVLYYTYE